MIMVLKLLINRNMKYGFFAAIFISACIFTPLPSSAGTSPFVDYAADVKAPRAGSPGELPPPLPYLQPQQALPEPVKEEPAKDVNVLGSIGGKVAVSVDGKMSVVRDGSEIGGCLIAFPDALCTEREKERHRKGQNSEKIKEENASLREKTLTLEKEFVALSKQVSFYENAAKRASRMEEVGEVYVPALGANARTIMDDNALILRTKIERAKVEAALKGKASEIYEFAGYTYAVVPGGLP
jgi:hypothetical protein